MSIVVHGIPKQLIIAFYRANELDFPDAVTWLKDNLATLVPYQHVLNEPINIDNLLQQARHFAATMYQVYDQNVVIPPRSVHAVASVAATEGWFGFSDAHGSVVLHEILHKYQGQEWVCMVLVLPGVPLV